MSDTPTYTAPDVPPMHATATDLKTMLANAMGISPNLRKAFHAWIERVESVCGIVDDPSRVVHRTRAEYEAEQAGYADLPVVSPVTVPPEQEPETLPLETVPAVEAPIEEPEPTPSPEPAGDAPHDAPAGS